MGMSRPYFYFSYGTISASNYAESNVFFVRFYEYLFEKSYSFPHFGMLKVVYTF